MAIKMKTHSGTKDRFKKTKNGKGNKIKFRKSCKNHLIKNKSKGSQKLGENSGLIVEQVNVPRKNYKSKQGLPWFC